MLMLVMTGKSPVRFRWDDGVSETTVTLSPEDDQETLVAKLRKVLDLAEGEASLRRVSALAREVRSEPAVAPVTGNGWASYAAPEIPERLRGEVEVEDGS